MNNRLLLVLVVLVLGAAGFGVWQLFPNNAQRRWTEAMDAATTGDHVRTQQVATELLRDYPDSTAVHQLLAITSVRTGEYEQTLASYKALSSIEAEQQSGYPDFLVTPTGELSDFLLEAGNICIKMGHCEVAEECWKGAIKNNSDQHEARALLAHILAAQGRVWEMKGLLEKLVEDKQAKQQHVLLLGLLNPTIADDALLGIWGEAVPDEPLQMLAFAAMQFGTGDTKVALPLMQEVKKAHPDLLSGHAWVGKALVRTDFNALIEWQSQLPENAESHPDIWYVRGLWADHENQLPAAIRCMSMAVQLNPDHRGACYYLASFLKRAFPGQFSEQVDYLYDRVDYLTLLHSATDALYRAPESVQHLGAAAETTWRLNRPHESEMWIAELEKQTTNPSARARVRQLRQLQEASRKNVRTQAEQLHQFLADLPKQQSLPQVVWKQAESQVTETVRVAVEFPTLTDESEATGIDFRFLDDRSEQDQPSIMHQTGGGVGVIDFDNDGWAEIYFPQGGNLPGTPEKPDFHNTLYRSVWGERFEEVSFLADVADLEFSQGCSVGDFDNDGFADLYVANIGPNKLYRNNGDGTFSEMPGPWSASPGVWTSSAAIADLNADGLPDIFDVNYLDVPLDRAVLCDSIGQNCGPLAYDGVDDRLWLNNGDETFEDVSEKAGLLGRKTEAKGLGLVVARLGASENLSLFIANDVQANFHYVRVSEDGEIPIFEDQAILSGLALDQAGAVQACMGIAVGDINADGTQDLFVTNFEDESNTMYLQSEFGDFQDVTAKMRLREASYDMLGFGAQFVDFNLDGALDVTLTNGHVFEYQLESPNEPATMRPQVFMNHEYQRFVEMKPTSETKWLNDAVRGRGLAVLDWNRDGLDDFAVSELNTRASLVTNRSSEVGNWIAFQFVGTTTARDAIGSRIDIRFDGETRSASLTAGSGYMASNEKLLRFGLGSIDSVDEVSVTWPNGRQESFQSPVVNRRYLLREGDGPRLIDDSPQPQ